MLALLLPPEGPEISDEIVSFSENLARNSVHRKTVADAFRERGNGWAARIVESFPVDGSGNLDEGAIDAHLVTVHTEMQRMSEEFQHGQRAAELLQPLIAAIREVHGAKRIRIVDVGCGTGFVIRWLGAHHALGDDVSLIGADFNAALIAEANRLANEEAISCQFVQANAFTLSETTAAAVPTIYISTGVLHHFRGAGLIRLFEMHAAPQTQAFVHFDFQPSFAAPLGSWLFHQARMRTPLARHDGVLSAIRAYSGKELLAAARSGAPQFVSQMIGVRLWGLPIPRAFHALLGMRPELEAALWRHLGSRAFWLGVQK